MKPLYSFFLNSCIFLWGIIALIPSNTFAQLSTIDNTSPSITQDLSKVIDSKDLDNPLRQGSRLIVESPIDPSNNYINILSDDIQNFTQAETFSLDLIKNIINILLSFTFFIIKFKHWTASCCNATYLQDMRLLEFHRWLQWRYHLSASGLALASHGSSHLINTCFEVITNHS